MFTGSTFGGPTINFITPSQIAQDSIGWNIKDVASASATYYGYTQSSSDQNKSVWKVRKDSTTGNVTTVQYAITTNTGTTVQSYGQYNFAWSGRTGLTYK